MWLELFLILYLRGRGKKCLNFRKLDSKRLDSWTLTSVVGDPVEVSTFTGDFSEGRLSVCQNLVMFAAGTGFTPMVRLIHHCIEDTKSRVWVSTKYGLNFLCFCTKNFLWFNEHLLFDSIKYYLWPK